MTTFESSDFPKLPTTIWVLLVLGLRESWTEIELFCLSTETVEFDMKEEILISKNLETSCETEMGGQPKLRW